MNKLTYVDTLLKKETYVFRLEYASGGRVVAGSNPVTPTGENEGVKRLA